MTGKESTMTNTLPEFFAGIKNNDLALVTSLLDANPSLASARDEQGLSAVLTAAYYQHPEVTALLLERGAALDLFEACAAGSLKDVKTLLEQNPQQINAFAADGFQPLGLAAFFGHTEIARHLLSQGAQADVPSRNGLHVSPLNSAAAGGHLEIARLLLEHGADPNQPQADEFVPLHAAAQNGQRELVELLLAHGADRTLRNKYGQNAPDIALESEHPELASLLE
jgi:ankyrin repeat protein